MRSNRLAHKFNPDQSLKSYRFKIDAKRAESEPRLMNGSLTDQLEQFVSEQVCTGRYQSASEVVHEGLRLLATREETERIKLEALRKMIREGLESGPAEPLNMEEIIATARSQRAQRT
jgi:antitoxin ParD1/3/4